MHAPQKKRHTTPSLRFDHYAPLSFSPPVSVNIFITSSTCSLDSSGMISSNFFSKCSEARDRARSSKVCLYSGFQYTSYLTPERRAAGTTTPERSTPYTRATFEAAWPANTGKEWDDDMKPYVVIFKKYVEPQKSLLDF